MKTLGQKAERIPKILRLLKKYWKKYPDLRFGQIISNCKEDPEDDVFYTLDSTIEKTLKKLLE